MLPVFLDDRPLAASTRNRCTKTRSGPQAAEWLVLERAGVRERQPLKAVAHAHRLQNDGDLQARGNHPEVLTDTWTTSVSSVGWNPGAARMPARPTAMTSSGPVRTASALGQQAREVSLLGLPEPTGPGSQSRGRTVPAPGELVCGPTALPPLPHALSPDRPAHEVCRCIHARYTRRAAAPGKNASAGQRSRATTLRWMGFSSADGGGGRAPGASRRSPPRTRSTTPPSWLLRAPGVTSRSISTRSGAAPRGSYISRAKRSARRRFARTEF
jgi:hypothetical protein